jgi:hypothetical protein
LIREQGERRFRIHCCDQPLEAEHLSLSWKETGFEDAIKGAVPLHELSGAFWSGTGGTRQFVGRIAAQRNEIQHLVWIDAIPLPDPFGPNAWDFPPRDG